MRASFVPDSVLECLHGPGDAVLLTALGGSGRIIPWLLAESTDFGVGPGIKSGPGVLAVRPWG